MKTTLYASLTANGHVLVAADRSEIPREILTDFLGHVRRVGNVVIGRRTFDQMDSGDSAGAFAGIDVVVLSRQRSELPGAHPAGAPEEALRLLSDRGHAEALIGGGPTAYDAFLERELVDELILNITPVLAGPDSPFLPGSRPAALQLLETRSLGDGEIQLHYQVSR